MDTGTGKKPQSDLEEDSPKQGETEADQQPGNADALNDARALQQMIEGTADATDEFERIERKRERER